MLTCIHILVNLPECFCLLYVCKGLLNSLKCLLGKYVFKDCTALEKIILPVTEKLGYELYDVEYVKEGKDWYVRLYIDSENGINLDDCEKVSNAITEII